MRTAVSPAAARAAPPAAAAPSIRELLKQGKDIALPAADRIRGSDADAYAAGRRLEDFMAGGRSVAAAAKELDPDLSPAEAVEAAEKEVLPAERNRLIENYCRATERRESWLSFMYLMNSLAKTDDAPPGFSKGAVQERLLEYYLRVRDLDRRVTPAWLVQLAMKQPASVGNRLIERYYSMRKGSLRESQVLELLEGLRPSGRHDPFGAEVVRARITKDYQGGPAPDKPRKTAAPALLPASSAGRTSLTAPLNADVPAPQRAGAGSLAGPLRMGLTGAAAYGLQAALLHLLPILLEPGVGIFLWVIMWAVSSEALTSLFRRARGGARGAGSAGPAPAMGPDGAIGMAWKASEPHETNRLIEDYYKANKEALDWDAVERLLKGLAATGRSAGGFSEAAVRGRISASFLFWSDEDKPVEPSRVVWAARQQPGTDKANRLIERYYDARKEFLEEAQVQELLDGLLGPDDSSAEYGKRAVSDRISEDVSLRLLARERSGGPAHALALSVEEASSVALRPDPRVPAWRSRREKETARDIRRMGLGSAAAYGMHALAAVLFPALLGPVPAAASLLLSVITTSAIALNQRSAGRGPALGPSEAVAVARGLPDPSETNRAIEEYFLGMDPEDLSWASVGRLMKGLADTGSPSHRFSKEAVRDRISESYLRSRYGRGLAPAWAVWSAQKQSSPEEGNRIIEEYYYAHRQFLGERQVDALLEGLLGPEDSVWPYGKGAVLKRISKDYKESLSLRSRPGGGGDK